MRIQNDRAHGLMLAAGIESTRIDIRALGEQSGSGAPDRVESKFWRPAGAGRVYSHWSSDQQIVAFQGGTFLGGPSSLNAAAVPGSPAAADMRGPGPSPAGSARVTMQLVRWSLGNADMALLPVETAVPLPATISATTVPISAASRRFSSAWSSCLRPLAAAPRNSSSASWQISFCDAVLLVLPDAWSMMFSPELLFDRQNASGTNYIRYKINGNTQ